MLDKFQKSSTYMETQNSKTTQEYKRTNFYNEIFRAKESNF